MSLVDLIGVLGLLFIIVAWLPETIKNIKSSIVNTRWGFLLLYGFGSFLLTVYSLILNNLIFTTLNGLAFALALINIIFKLKFNKKLISN